MEKFGTEGKDYFLVEIAFDIRKEDWAEYDLADGGRIRLKSTVTRIAKVVDAEGKQLRGTDGRLAFAVRHNTQVISSG